jgi:purine nucleosidase
MRDPVAAHEVLAAAPEGRRLLVPLDATRHAIVGEREAKLLDVAGTPAAAFLAAPLREVNRRLANTRGRAMFPLHDLLALATLICASIVRREVVGLAIDTGGSVAWGATVGDHRSGRPSGWPAWEVAVEGDPAAFAHILRTLFGGAGAEVRR